MTLATPTSSLRRPSPFLSPQRERHATYFDRWSRFCEFLLLSTLLLVAFCGWIATHVAQRLAHEYVLPLIHAQNFTTERRAAELTYYPRHCTRHDLTTLHVNDLILRYDDDDDNNALLVETAVKHQMKHGVSVFPNILSPQSAHSVREFILRQNQKNEDMFDVIENNNRWSFAMRVNQHPSVTRALKEVLSHPFLVAALERLMGPDPAVIEFTGITSAFGAKEQRWHADVVPEGNGVKWGRTFVPSYSLFIPLQNISAAMGATKVCPGSHMCASGCFDYCQTHGFPVSGTGVNDRWTVGSGALVNQQTMHMGAAHQDMNGPHRVLFILTFAPRPQYNENHDDHIETRMIGQGGSYSLHWSQWGHTLRDFREAAIQMRQPWRTLRSFGLYKSPTQHWGYDYITQASARIANDELGFYYNDLVSYVNKGGFELLPKWLHAKLPVDDDESSYAIWVPYYLETLQNCQDFFLRVYSSLALALSFLLIFRMVCNHFKRGCSINDNSHSNQILSVFTSLVLLLVLHVTVLVLAWKYLDVVATCWWGRTIRSRRAYRWPKLPHSFPHHFNLDHSRYTNLHSENASRSGGTLPTMNDTMVLDDLQSEYLGVISSVHDITHDGNALWIEAASSHAGGYNQLPASLQRQLCTSLLEWNRQLGRRVLIKNANSDWSEATSSIAMRWCHKDLMMRDDDSLNSYVIRQVDILLTRTKFGYWRDMILMRRGWIPRLLGQLQDEILRYRSHSFARKNGVVSTPSFSSANGFDLSFQGQPMLQNDKPSFQRRSYPDLRKSPTTQNMYAASTGIPTFHNRHLSLLSREVEIQTNDWVQVGDDVEAAYENLMTDWYRATIISVDIATMTWTVVYRDGESESGLCQYCVRPFHAFQINENVGFRKKRGSDYGTGRIVAVHRSKKATNREEILYDVQVGKDVFKGVTSDVLRREEMPFSQGNRVNVYLSDAEDWFAGIIKEVNEDRSVAVLFDDGEYYESVSIRSVVLAD